MREDDERSRGNLDLGRILALSDGVFAIAMTLVAFQIKVPTLGKPTENGLVSALTKNGSSYFSFLITFMVIGLFWMAHHRIFRNIEQATESLMLLNLVLLMAVAALPFPSSLLGQYGGERVSVILYACSMIVVGLLLTALTYMAAKRRLFSRSASEAELKLGLWRSMSMVGVFVLSIPVAVASPTVAPFVWIATFPLRMVNPNRHRRSGSARRSRPGATSPASKP
ncbi:MAG: TMEM175 family protein [Acidimicrobiales bacterium]